jgi:hypothetical protein
MYGELTMTRIYLGLVTLMLLGGGAYLFMPSLFEMNGQPLTSAAARADVRAMYGALSIGLGLFVLPGVMRRVEHHSELRLCALIFGMLALGRLFGMIVEGGDQSFNFGGLAMEAIFALGGLFLWRREQRGTDPLAAR